MTERRTVPPETGQDIRDEMGGILEFLAGEDPAFQASSRVAFVRNPWQADMESGIATALQAVVERLTGGPAQTMTQTGWADSALLGDAGIPTIIYGPSGEGAHAASEWVDCESLVVCAQVYAGVMEQFCS